MFIFPLGPFIHLIVVCEFNKIIHYNIRIKKPRKPVFAKLHIFICRKQCNSLSSYSIEHIRGSGHDFLILTTHRQKRLTIKRN